MSASEGKRPGSGDLTEPVELLESDELEEKLQLLLDNAGITDARGEASWILEVARAQAAGDAAAERAYAMAAKRAAGTPLAYVVERSKFMGVELYCAPGALVPRPETELLGATAVRVLGEMGGTRAIDMCCGAGNLACGIAAALPDVTLWASDLTDGCVAVARRNVERLGLGARVTVKQGDLFAGLAGLGLEGTIAAVICNPPYISTGRLAKDRATLLDHEPREAFDGGPYGLSIHQRVIKDALAYLEPGGWLLFEIGLGQDKQVKLLFDRGRAYEETRHEVDAEGNPRVIYARTKADKA